MKSLEFRGWSNPRKLIHAKVNPIKEVKVAFLPTGNNQSNFILYYSFLEHHRTFYNKKDYREMAMRFQKILDHTAFKEFEIVIRV